MIEERFAQGSSLLHNRDPRGKIVVAFFYTTTVALLNSFPALLMSLVFSFALLLLSKIPLSAAVKRLLLVNGFTLFIWITLPFTYGSDLFYLFDTVALSRGGVILASLITIKTNTIVLAIIALLATSTVAELGHALDKLKFPTKLVFMLLYSYRYVFVIHQEYTRLLRAAKMRSFSPRTNLHTYRTFAYLFGMTLVKSYNRSQRVHQAMLLRGFQGRLLSLHQCHFTFGDTLFTFSLLVANVCIVTLAFL